MTKISEKTRLVKHEVTIFTDFDQWSNTLSEAVLCQLQESFRPEKKAYSRISDNGWKTYKLPKDVEVYPIGCGEYARPNMPKVKFVKTLDSDKNGKTILRSNKGYVEDFDDETINVLIPTREYFLSNREFENYAHKNIERLKDKPDFWAIMAVRSVCPQLDYIDVGLAIGHN